MIRRRAFLAVPVAGFIASRVKAALRPVQVTCLGSTTTTITLEVFAPDGAPGGVLIQYQSAASCALNHCDVFEPGDAPNTFPNNPPTVCRVTLAPIAAGGTATVVIGSLSAQPGVEVQEGCMMGLDCSTTYHFRLKGLAAPGQPDTDSDPVYTTCATTPCEAGCTFTQGYWKNHPDVWPVESLILGTVTYTKAQLLSILREPVKGNGLVSLAHQLIAAKLNVANGTTCTAAATAISGADQLIGSLVVPPVGTGYLEPRTTSSYTGTLDAFNSGQLEGCASHCE